MEPKTVLVCDDEAHILHVVSFKLRNAGFNVLTAHDGEEGLELIQSQHVDLVITDYQMPGITGLDLARQIHREVSRRTLPVVLLTAHGLALDTLELSQAGIAACLSKPFSPREVLGRVNELLYGARMETQEELPQG